MLLLVVDAVAATNVTAGDVVNHYSLCVYLVSVFGCVYWWLCVCACVYVVLCLCVQSNLFKQPPFEQTKLVSQHRGTFSIVSIQQMFV